MTQAMVVALLFFIAGLAGTVLPILPGGILIYGGMIVYGFMTGFQTLDGWFYLIQGMAFLLILLVDYVATVIGTRQFGGSRYAAWGAAMGIILGLVLGPPGIIMGPFIGATAAELLQGKEFKPAVQAGLGTLIGLLGGTVVKLVAEIMMIVYFFLQI